VNPVYAFWHIIAYRRSLPFANASPPDTGAEALNTRGGERAT